MSLPQKIAIYPGTFDPITNGHLDIIHRASPLFDKVIVTIAINHSKVTLFSMEERFKMIQTAIEGMKNVELDTFNGLVVDYAKKVGALALIRGLRAISDFEYEFQIALMNRKQHHDIDTVFLMPDERYTYLSSKIVKELARLNGNIESFVPPIALQMMKEKFKV